MFNNIQPETYQAQLDAKQTDISNMFAQFEPPVMAVYHSEPLHYRMRAEFSVWHEGDDFFFIMHNPDTKEKISIDQYAVASTLINQAMIALRQLIIGNELLKRRLFQVDFLSTLSGELLISLIYHKPLDDAWQEQAMILQTQLQTIAKVFVVGRARKQKIVLSQDYVNESLTVDGKNFLYQQVENSFTQPNAGVNQKMLSWARAATANCSGDLIELYCGNGNFSIALAENFNRVLGTEISKTSVKSAQVNIAQNNIHNIDILRMSSEEFSQAMNGEREFRRLNGFDLSSYQYQTVLVDPPRAGLDPDSVELVRRFEQIIYISCNPQTLVENLTALATTHKIAEFALFDQFPYTHHIECGVVLTRR